MSFYLNNQSLAVSNLDLQAKEPKENFMKKTQVLLVIIHIIGWLLFVCIPAFFVSRNPSEDYPLLSIKILLFCTYYIAFFYTNTQQLIPSLYLKKKQILYFSVIASLLVATFFLKPFDRLVAHPMPNHSAASTHADRRPPPDAYAPPPNMQASPPPGRDFGQPGPQDPGPQGGRVMIDIISIVLFLLVWAVGFALQLVSLWKNTETRVAHAEAERARAELSFLKARINPHFLFNTLNNIYSMAMIQHDQTAASIMKLSNIMRYITDDIDHDFVSLHNEIQCVDNYIALQRLRLTKNTPVEYSVVGDASNKQIAPLILMPFVENVFKYGVSNHQLSPICIKIEIAEKAIYFYATNRIVGMQFNAERSGIGLSNTRQRLQLLYPGRHLLHIKSSEEQFTVELTIYAN